MQTANTAIQVENFEQEFNDLMYNHSVPKFFASEPQVKSPNDFFVKFSLYPELSNSLTSTSTSFPLQQK